MNTLTLGVKASFHLFQDVAVTKFIPSQCLTTTSVDYE
jgi:hypothetical protein